MGIKAVVMKGPGQMELREFPRPKAEEGAMLVRMVAAGICGTDRHMLEGCLVVNFPIIPGHENVGIIEEIGGSRAKADAEGKPVKVGDLIIWDSGFYTCGECYYCKWLPSNYGLAFCEKGRSYGFENCDLPPHLLGGWAEYIYLYPGTWCYKLPDNLTVEQAVLVDVLASVNGVERAVFHASWLNMGLGLGRTVVIQGAGAVGIMAAVKAQLLGATRVIMVGGPAHRLAMAKEFGVDETIDIARLRESVERVEAIKELTGGLGADLVVECAGVASAVPEGLEMLRRGGVYVEIGNFTNTGSTTLNPYEHICHKEVTIIGQWGYTSHQYRKDLALLSRHAVRFPFEKLVTHRFALWQYEEALEVVKREECIKAIFLA